MRTSLNVSTLLVAMLTLASEPVLAVPVPVLISFDVEMDQDAQAIPLLPIREQATFFVLGSFVERHPELVAELARSNTIGSHSYCHQHLVGLDDNTLRMDLLLSRMLIQEATGQPVQWFRAPYMEYDQRVSATLLDLGFRYGSSDYETGLQDIHLVEMPVSLGLEESSADDYHLFVVRQMTDAQVLDWLVESYRQRSTTGRPFVMMLHPRIAIDHVEVLSEFIRYVRQQDGAFLSFDQYLQRISRRSPHRLGVWVDFSLGDHDPDQIASDLAGTGITDVFLMARSPEGVDYFREGNDSSSDSLFGRTLALLQAQGIRVHAWIPVLLNRRLATERPELAMIGAGGAPSGDWISPAHPEVLDSFTQTVREIADRFPVDGIHLDYIRFPSLDYDFSQPSLQAFNRDTGLEPPEEDPAQWLLSEASEAWTDWRADLLCRFVEAISRVVQERGLVLSAALLAQSTTSYLVMRSSGQDYRHLSEHLDLVIPMAYHHIEQRPVDWIANVVHATRLQIGERPLYIGLSTFQRPGDWSYPIEDFEQALGLAHTGTDGIVAYPYLYLFGRGDEQWNMPAGSSRAFLRMESERTSMLPLSAGVSGLIVSILVFLAWRRRRPGSARPRQPVAAPFVLSEWRELDREIQQGSFSGALAEQVCMWLRRYASARVSHYRIMFLLDTVLCAKDREVEVERVLGGIPGWSLLGKRYLEEACLTGHLVRNDGMIEVTEQGRTALHTAQQEGYSRDLWVFIENRLHETLQAPCPHCDAVNPAYWFWLHFDCTSCRRQVDLRHCQQITLQPPSVPLNGYVIPE
ncbi:MAG: polysaccharide deacetylase family protein [Bradymonadales bacterium]|nr:polysaccharide deacetylase family protein [Bradymonadales bacterium]